MSADRPPERIEVLAGVVIRFLATHGIESNVDISLKILDREDGPDDLLATCGSHQLLMPMRGHEGFGQSVQDIKTLNAWLAFALLGAGPLSEGVADA